MNPRISIIVPVYNTERWLHRCVDSILAQTYTDFELLLIDDGSNDNSGAICDEYAIKDKRVKVFHKSNGGVSSARNLGLDNARGEWITFVDGDDWLEPNAVNDLIDKSMTTDADIVFCDFWFDYPEHRITHRLYDWTKQGAAGLNEYIATTWTCLWGSIQKKQLYVENGLRSPESIRFCEDFHLIVRLCFFANKISKVTKPLYHYRQQASSVIHNLNKSTQEDERLVYSDIIEFFKKHDSYMSYKKSMAWRTIRASAHYAIDENLINKFYEYNPGKEKYIFSCPFISLKLKIQMWFISHKLKFIPLLFIRMREKLLK